MRSVHEDTCNVLYETFLQIWRILEKFYFGPSVSLTQLKLYILTYFGELFGNSWICHPRCTFWGTIKNENTCIFIQVSQFAFSYCERVPYNFCFIYDLNLIYTFLAPESMFRPICYNSLYFMQFSIKKGQKSIYVAVQHA